MNSTLVPLFAAMVAGFVSIVSAIISLAGIFYTQAKQSDTNARIEQLRDSLQSARDATAARREYEYEARRRLYAEAQPLLFQMYEYAGLASERIPDLAKRALRGNLGSDGWLTDRTGYYLPFTIYTLLAPTVTFFLLRDKLTLFDLTLDATLELNYNLSYAAYDAWSNDFPLAHQAPAIEYDPNTTQKWEGLMEGERDRPARVLVDPSGKPRLITYAEFEDQYLQPRSKLNSELKVFKQMIHGFTPSSRPVLWRVLVSQFFVYRALRVALDSSKRRGDAATVPAIDLAQLLEEATTVFDGMLIWGNTEADRTASLDAIRIGRRYLAHTLLGKTSFRSCPECRECTWENNVAVAHGV
ncbi:MAG: hypothetical protein WB615_11980 [Candidatus Tumulicola sp.]